VKKGFGQPIQRSSSCTFAQELAVAFSSLLVVFLAGCALSNAGSQVAITVSPASALVQVGKTQQFAATVAGTTNTAVSWAATSGTISASGMYTAPNTGGSYTVTATSVADNTKSASAAVTVSTAPVVSVSISPASASLLASGTQQFTASVTGSSNTAVTWAATGGAISTSGLYTAPATAGTFTVKATSVADNTKSASAAVTVSTAPVVSVNISPASASLLTSGTQQFTASVTGSSNTAVTWSATGGTVSTSGLYTAPATAGTFTVKATSVADNTKSASAAVTVLARLSIVTTSLPGATQNVAYSQQLGAAGGTLPYTWTLSGGSLPAGLSLSSAGGISGTPTGTGTSSFTVQVKDANSQTASKALSISVTAAVAPLSIVTTSLPDATQNVAYSQTLAATGGTTPYIWSLASGTLPAGLSLGTSGTISGTPTQSGQFSFAGEVSDSSSPAQTASRSFTINVATPGAAQTVTVNSANTHQTWRAWRSYVNRTFYDGFPGTSTPGCSGSTATAELSDSVWNSLVSYLVNDMGTAGFGMAGHKQQTPAFDLYSNVPTVMTSYGVTGYSCRSLAYDLSRSQTPFRNAIIAAGNTPDIFWGLYGYPNLSNTPSDWQSDATNAAHTFDAILQWIYTNNGWYPNYITLNEPNDSIGSGYFSNTGGGTPWLGGFYQDLYNYIQADGNTVTKLMAPTPVSGSSTQSQLNSMDNTSNIENIIPMVAYHCYSCPSTTEMGNIATRAASHGAVTAMTEFGSGLSNTYASGLTLLINWILPEVNYGNVVAWNADGVFDTCPNASPACPNTWAPGNLPGYGVDPAGTTFYLLPTYYVQRQFARYVRPGYIRVDSASSNTGVIQTTAFKRPADGGLVVLIINADSGASHTVTVSGLNNAAYTVYQLDPTMCGTSGQFRCTPKYTIVTPSSGSVNLSMPAYAVWTLVQ
jgi:hypothetical protein